MAVMRPNCPPPRIANRPPGRTIDTFSSWIGLGAAGGVRNLARGVGHASYHTHLQATPIDVSQLLAGALFDEYSSVVLTSATLTVASGATASGNAVSGFEHISRRLGLTLARELVVPSHFHYPRQA